MSRNLDEEYRKMVEGEIPDLWERIDSGLKDKNVPDVRGKTPSGKKKKITRILPWIGGITAAAILFVLILPGIIGWIGGKGNNVRSVDLTPAAESVMDAAYETEEAAETAETMEDQAVAKEAKAALKEQGGAEFYAGNTAPDIAATEDIGNNTPDIAATEAAAEALFAYIDALKTEGKATMLTVYLSHHPDGLEEEERNKTSSREMKLSEESEVLPRKGGLYLVEIEEDELVIIEEIKP